MTQVDTTDASTATETTRLTFEADATETEKPDVYVTDRFTDGYNTERAALGGDTFAAKDIIKFDWEQTHHKFDGNTKQWLVDAAALDALDEKLAEAGFTFGDEADPEFGNRMAELLDTVSEGDHITVEYEKKNGNGADTHTGHVFGIRGTTDTADLEPMVAFSRDSDNHTMYLRHDSKGVVALYTSGSAYPFIGRVTAVELRADR